MSATCRTASTSGGRSPSTLKRWGSRRTATGCAWYRLSAGDGTAHLVQLPRGRYEAPNLARMLADPGRLKLLPLTPASESGGDRALAGRCRGAGLLHQDRLAPEPERSPDLARAEGPVPGPAGRRGVEAAAELRLGRRPPVAGAAALCCQRRAVPAPAEGTPGRHAGARRAQPRWRRPASTSCRCAPELDLAGWAETDIFAHFR